MKQFAVPLVVLIACALLVGCKRNPQPADWSAPALGAAWLHGDECTAMGTIAFQEADGAASRPVTMIDDRRIAGLLEGAATKLIDDKKSVKATEFAEQLKRTKCRVKLGAPASAVPMTPNEIYGRCAPGVLVLSGIYKCNKCTKWHAAPASGFVLNESGVAVTNYHVFDKTTHETFVAMTHDGKVYPVKEVLAASQADDLAIVQLDLGDGAKLTPLPLLADAPVGSPVTLISHPDRRFYSLTTGIISRYHTVMKNNQAMPMVSITADYARGSSGAPVLSDRGAVIGIVASTHSVYYTNENGKQENLQMVFKQCIPTSSLMKLIEAVK